CFAIKSGGFAADAIITAEKEKKTIDKYNGSLSEITDSFVKAKHRAEYFFKYEKFIASVYSEEKTLELFGKFFLRI
nr:hypothetical protein [bacterium]